MDCIIHGILQARILEWVALPFTRDLPNPGIEPVSPAVPALPGRFSTLEPLGKPLLLLHLTLNGIILWWPAGGVRDTVATVAGSQLWS